MIARMTQGGAWAIVPVKRFDRAKSRLAGVFTPSERAALAKAMLGDVLEQLLCARSLSGVVVVTDDADACAMAAEFGFETEADPREDGVNDAVLRGVGYARARGASAIVVAPGDIPFVTARELEAVVSALASASVALAPAARDGGTNILGLAPPDAISPAFGENSFARHHAAAKALGAEAFVLALPGASRDIDVAADLAAAATLAGGRRTRAWLVRFDLAKRSVSERQCYRGTP